VISKTGALGLIDIDQNQVYKYQDTNPIARLPEGSSQLPNSRLIGKVKIHLYGLRVNQELAGEV
jgi:hypothetical protein